MSGGIFEGWGQDLKYAWRGLLQHPGFSVLAMLTLALGLGATTAIFSVVYGVLLQPLPYPQPDRLVAVWEVTRSGNHTRLADPNFDDFRDRNHSFAALAKYRSGIAPVTGMAKPVRDGMFLLVNERENPRTLQEFDALAKQPERRGTADFCVVTPGYFQALGIPLRRGRGFDARDGIGAPHAAVINESLARSRWPNQDPIGRTLQFGNMDGDLHLLTVVGVAADTHEDGPEAPPRPIVYANLLQRSRSAFSVVIHTANDSPALVAAARAVLRAEAPAAPPRFRSFTQMYAAALRSRRFNLLLVGFFAPTALCLAVAGTYGVAAYGVAQRTREIGVRMALVAKPAHVVSLILREEARTALAGVAVGALCALTLTRAIQALLFGVSASDPLTLLSVAVVLAIVAGLACFVPARRATRVDPLVALREERRSRLGRRLLSPMIGFLQRRR